MPKLNAGAVSIDYERRGEGPPSLMVNGFRGSRRRCTASPLGCRNCGHGGSIPPENCIGGLT